MIEERFFSLWIINLCCFLSIVSYQNAGLNYVNAQKLVAVPTFTQATFRPMVSPTAATSQSAYTNAYVQPTGIAPIKVRSDWGSDSIRFVLFIYFVIFQYNLAQPTSYYNSGYAPKIAYAPSLSGTSSNPYVSSNPYGSSNPYVSSNNPYVSSLQQSASQAIPSAQAYNTNGAIQYASQAYQPSLNAAKYGYTQIPTAQKYFYSSS